MFNDDIFFSILYFSGTKKRWQKSRVLSILPQNDESDFSTDSDDQLTDTDDQSDDDEVTYSLDRDCIVNMAMNNDLISWT